MDASELTGIREELGLSKKELGAAIGIPANTISRWERGEVQIAHPTVFRMALNWLKLTSRITPAALAVLMAAPGPETRKADNTEEVTDAGGTPPATLEATSAGTPDTRGGRRRKKPAAA